MLLLFLFIIHKKEVVFNLKKVYAIKNKLNEKMYVGSSRQHKDNRWKAHLKALRNNKHHSDKLQRAWNKYGEENFEYIILEELQNNEDQFDKEQYWIDHYDSFENGYNSAPSANKVIMAEETKEKIRQSMKGRPLTPEHIKAFSQAKIGEKRTLEARKKMSDAKKGKFVPNEHRSKISKTMTGKKRSEESKQRNSEAGKNKTQQHKDNIELAREKRKNLTAEIIFDIIKDRENMSYDKLADKYQLNRSMIFRICSKPDNFLKKCKDLNIK